METVLGVIVRRGEIRPAHGVGWGGVAIGVTVALVLGSGSAVAVRHYLKEREAAAPLAGVTAVHAQPLPVEVGPGTMPTPVALPTHVLLQVPFTTQAPLNNWAQHQESCEAANLTMLVGYWHQDTSAVIDPHR